MTDYIIDNAFIVLDNKEEKDNENAEDQGQKLTENAIFSTCTCHGLNPALLLYKESQHLRTFNI